jgi:hypothetical protein
LSSAAFLDAVMGVRFGGGGGSFATGATNRDCQPDSKVDRVI